MDAPYLHILGDNIRRLRKGLHLNQAQFAEKVDIDLRHFQDIEAGKVDVGIDILRKRVEPQMNADERRWDAAPGCRHFPTDDRGHAAPQRTAASADFPSAMPAAQPGTEAHGTVELE